MGIDTQLLRMQYEILNKPILDIAVSAGVPESLVSNEAVKHNWKQWFPEPDLQIGEDPDMSESSEDFIERTSTRLKMFNIVKDIYLAQKYLALESAIIDSALSIAENAAIEPRDVKALASLYSNMTKTSLRDTLTKFSLGQDESGLPTVIFKDFSGQVSRT